MIYTNQYSIYQFTDVIRLKTVAELRHSEKTNYYPLIELDTDLV